MSALISLYNTFSLYRGHSSLLRRGFHSMGHLSSRQEVGLALTALSKFWFPESSTPVLSSLWAYFPDRTSLPLICQQNIKQQDRNAIKMAARVPSWHSVCVQGTTKDNKRALCSPKKEMNTQLLGTRLTSHRKLVACSVSHYSVVVLSVTSLTKKLKCGQLGMTRRKKGSL